MIQYEKYWTHDPTITVFCDYMSSDTPFENFATMFTYLFVTTQGIDHSVFYSILYRPTML